MHVISRKALNEFIDKHSNSKSSMDAWYFFVKKETWTDYNDIKSKYPKTDLIEGDRYVFDVGGNNYRIVADVYFIYKKVYIKGVFTHAEYDKVNKRNMIMSL